MIKVDGWLFEEPGRGFWITGTGFLQCAVNRETAKQMMKRPERSNLRPRKVTARLRQAIEIEPLEGVKGVRLHDFTTDSSRTNCCMKWDGSWLDPENCDEEEWREFIGEPPIQYKPCPVCGCTDERDFSREPIIDGVRRDPYWYCPKCDAIWDQFTGAIVDPNTVTWDDGF